MLWDHRRIYLTLGLGVMVIGAARSSRVVLRAAVGGARRAVGEHHGGHLRYRRAAVEMLLFYPAGSVMDRFGRIWVAVPCVVLLGVGMLALPLTHSALAVDRRRAASPPSATAWARASS